MPASELKFPMMRALRVFAAGALILMSVGCATAGRVVLTPVTVVRDVVDAPLVTLANVFEYWADKSRIASAPTAGVGWNLTGRPTMNLGYDLSYLLFKGLSGLFGGVDYVIGRSIWPNFPRGVSPWNKDGSKWDMLYFPNTRVLWGDERPIWGNQWKPGDARASSAPHEQEASP